MSIQDDDLLKEIKNNFDHIMDSVSKLKELENDVDMYFKSNLDENDYEYVKKLINGEKPTNIPNDIKKINELKFLIAKEYVYNVLKKDYINNFGNIFGLSDEIISDENLSKKLK